MNAQAADFRCPVCSFPIYNRLVAKCENCGLELPGTLVYPKDKRIELKQQFAAEEWERLRAEQEARAAETRMREEERRRWQPDHRLTGR